MEFDLGTTFMGSSGMRKENTKEYGYTKKL